MATFDYAPAPESRAVVDLQPSYGLFIGGEFVDGSGEAFKTINPATEETLAEVAEASADDVDRAVKAARAAYRGVWGRMSGADRGKYLFRIARIMQERSRELAVLETLDNGKPIKESRDVDVPLAAAHFFYHAGWADKLGYAALGPDPRPLGVVGQVIPWNFPLLMLAWKIAPALACGNTVVLKPAETTPLTALLFAQICQQADLPIVCPHSLRGLHSSLAVQAGASSSYVARALGHGSDEVTKRHYISQSAMDSARSARVSEALAGNLDGLIATLLALSPAQRDQVCSAIGYRR